MNSPSKDLVPFIQANDVVGLRNKFHEEKPEVNEWLQAWGHLLAHPAPEQQDLFGILINHSPGVEIAAINVAVHMHRSDLASMFESAGPRWAYLESHLLEAVKTPANPWTSYLVDQPGSDPALAWALNLGLGKSQCLINLAQVWRPDPAAAVAVWKNVNPQGDGRFGGGKFPAPAHQRKIESQIDRTLSEIAHVPVIRSWIDAFLRAAREDRPDLQWPQLAHYDLVKERFQKLQDKPVGSPRPRRRA